MNLSQSQIQYDNSDEDEEPRLPKLKRHKRQQENAEDARWAGELDMSPAKVYMKEVSPVSLLEDRLLIGPLVISRFLEDRL